VPTSRHLRFALALVLASVGAGCNRGKNGDPPDPKPAPSIEEALADARARAPKPAATLETQARVLIANLRLAHRQMVQTTEGEAERLPAEVVRLSHLGRPVIPFLEPVLADPEPDTRYFAMQVLEEVGDGRELDRYIAALADPDFGVVRIASEAIGRHRNADTVPILFQALEEGRIRQIRWGNVLKPRKPFDRDLLPYLIRRLTDERAELRLSASIALAQVTGRDFGFDPNGSETDRRRAVMRWESWWTDEGRTAELPGTAARPEPGRDRPHA
jgi:HEAT repeat protein